MKSIENSQKVHGWTDFCLFLDHLTTIDISYTAPWHQRHRYESTITQVWNDVDRQAGPMRARRDLSPPPELSQVFDKSKVASIPSCRRTREYGKDHSMKHCEQTWSSRVNIGKPTGRNLPLHHPHNNGGNTNTKTLKYGANTKTHNGANTSGGMSDGYRLFQSRKRFFTDFTYRHQRRSCTRRGLKTEHLVARTFYSVLSVSRTFDLHTCVWLKISQELCGPSAQLKSHPLTACFIDHSSTRLTHFHHFCSTPPPSTPNHRL